MQNEKIIPPIEMQESVEVTMPDTEALEKKPYLQKFKAKLKTVFGEYGYLLLAGIIPAAIVYIMYVSRLIYPFGDSTVMVLDLNGQYVYFYEALRNAVLGDRSLLYSFSRSLGGEFLGIYAYYIASPFSYIVCLFKQSQIQEALLTIFLLKAAGCGMTMGYYLHQTGKYERARFRMSGLGFKDLRHSRFGVIGFSVMYALCSYCIINQHNSMWIDAVMWLPIVTYGIEQLVKYGKYKLFVVSLATTVMSNFYIGYMVCIYVAAYYFFYIFAYKKDNFNNPTGEKHHFKRSFIRIATWSALAVGVAFVIIWSAYTSLQFGKNTFSDPSWAVEGKFNLWQLLIKLYPSSYDTVRPSGLPVLYCGLLTLILAPAFFLSKKRGAREKIACGVFIIFFVASFFISVMDLVWHGFQKPNWLNYRYSFMLCFFLITLAFRAFTDLKYIGRKSILAITTVVGLLIVILQKIGGDLTVGYGNKKNADVIIDSLSTVWLTLGCLAIFFVLICLIKNSKNKELISGIMVFFICGEMFVSGLCDLNDLDSDVVFTKHSYYTNFMDDIRPISVAVMEDDPSFYRMEKTYARKNNDNMALDIRGVANSTSTLNADTIELLRLIGYHSQSHNSRYAGGNPVTDSLIGIKYIITDEDMSNMYGDKAYETTDFTNNSEDYWVYLNEYAQSIAFAASDKINYINTDNYNTPFELLNAMITAILGENDTVEVFKPCVLADKSMTNLKCTTSTYKDTPDHDLYQKIDNDSAGTLTLTYEVPYNGGITVHDVTDAINGKLNKGFAGFDFMSGLSDDDATAVSSACKEYTAMKSDSGEYYVFRLTDKANSDNDLEDIRAWFDRYSENNSDKASMTVRGRFVLCTVADSDLTEEITGVFEDTVCNYEFFCCFPATWSRDVIIKVDGTQKYKYSGEKPHITPLGTSNSESMILSVTLDNTYNSLYIWQDVENYLYYIDWDVFEDAMSRIQSGSFIVSDNYTEDDLKGIVTTDKDEQLMFTTIPYDKGWKIYVDGKQVESTSAIKLGLDKTDSDGNTTVTNNALLTFTVPTAGEHKVELKYRPNCFVYGGIITCTSIVIFFLTVIFGRSLLKIKPVAHLYAPLYRKRKKEPDFPIPELTDDTKYIPDEDYVLPPEEVTESKKTRKGGDR